MRESLSDMISCVEKGLLSLKFSERMSENIHKAVDILTDNWDYRFDSDKP